MGLQPIAISPTDKIEGHPKRQATVHVLLPANLKNLSAAAVVQSSSNLLKSVIKIILLFSRVRMLDFGL